MARKKKHTGQRIKRSRKRDRIYTRCGPDGLERYYADFRDIGGGRKALIVPGETRATIDLDTARKLAADAESELLSAKRATQRVKAGVEKARCPGLQGFAARHLIQKAKAGRVTTNWLERTEEKLALACAFFGGDRELISIGVSDLQAFLIWLQERPGRKGNKSLSGGTQRHYLNALSNLYRRAQAEGVVPPGYNPVAAMLEKPSAKREEARWLEVHEGALLLESALRYKPQDATRALPFAHALIATFLLTGGRKSEVLGLQVSDVNFERKTVTFRPNDFRRLKTETSFRVVPLWPQLAEILRAHLRTNQIAGGLLFPSPATRNLVVDLRKQLDAIAGRAGWQPAEIRTKMFRHTYCSARLQTLDGGAPVSPYTVAKELGHGGMSLVNRVYGHLGTVRHRSASVEYYAEVIRKISDVTQRRAFAERLKAVQRRA